MRILILLFWLIPAMAYALSGTDRPVKVTKMAQGFKKPWAMGFLPEGGLIVTERTGALWRVTRDGKKERIRGLPGIAQRNQGGLLDILLPRDFARSRQLYFTYARPQNAGEGTALASATLPEGANRLQNVRTIFELTPGSKGGRHFGSRVVEGRDGKLYMTIGDRGDRPSAQDLGNENGSVIRLNRNGSIPSDNPFANTPGAQPEIWSYGHRNPQGAAIAPNGALWIHEHGAQGGDEINRIKKGANYGWPVIAYGKHYSGAKIGEGTKKAGMEQPAHYWDPSIAPSGMAIYSGNLFPEWNGDFFVGSLKFDYIARVDGRTMREVAKLKSADTRRVRDVRQGPDGAIWFISEGRGAIYRITPE